MNSVEPTAQSAFKAALREIVGPALRREGFRGSGSTWQLTSPDSDRAVVNAQSSAFNSREELRFIINLAVIPQPWWEWQQFQGTLGNTKSPKEYHGLWQRRLESTIVGDHHGSEAWWSVVDTSTASAAAEDVVHQLETVGIPLLRHLLDRRAMLATIRAKDLGPLGGGSDTYFDIALVVLLSDDMDSLERNQALARLSTSENEWGRNAFQGLTAWLSQREQALK
jgi:Domain of unknown function (DUF4304)